MPKHESAQRRKSRRQMIRQLQSVLGRKSLAHHIRHLDLRGICVRYRDLWHEVVYDSIDLPEDK